VSKTHLFLAAVGNYLKEYFIPATCLHVLHLRTESCDEPEAKRQLPFFWGVRLLTEKLEQRLVLHSEWLEITPLFPEHSRKHKSALRMVSERAAKQKGTDTEERSSDSIWASGQWSIWMAQ